MINRLDPESITYYILRSSGKILLRRQKNGLRKNLEVSKDQINQRIMKKILCLCFSFSLLFLLGCRGGKDINIDIKEGDKRIISNPDYLIIEVCGGRNGFGVTVWKFDRVINKTDTVEINKVLEELK